MSTETADTKPGFIRRVLNSVNFRSSGSVSASSPFSAWQRLFQTWGVKSTPLTFETAQSIPAMNRAIEVIASQIASLPISVWKKDSAGKLSEATKHPLHQLLKYRPHPLYSSYDFRSALVRQLMLKGNAYVIPGYSEATEIEQLELIDETPEIFKVENSWFYRFASIKQPVPADSVFHFKQNTLDGITGQSTIDLFFKTLERGIAEIDQGHAYFRNGGQVSGLLTPSSPLDPKQSQQAMDFWNKNNVGADKVGKVGMVPFGFNYLRLGDSIADSKLLEARKLTVEDISNITGVHPILLGNLDRATFTNVEELNRILVQFTLRSVAKIIEDEINSKAFSRSERAQHFLRINFDGLLRGDTKSRAEYYAKMYNIRALNPNEIRELENRNPYEGGDDYGQPLASNARPADQKKETDG